MIEPRSRGVLDHPPARVTTLDVWPRSRDALRPRFSNSFRPLKNQRAQGMPDARCTRGPVCKLWKVAHTSIQGSGGNPTFPAQWLYGL